MFLFLTLLTFSPSLKGQRIPQTQILLQIATQELACIYRQNPQLSDKSLFIGKLTDLQETLEHIKIEKVFSDTLAAPQKKWFKTVWSFYKISHTPSQSVYWFAQSEQSQENYRLWGFKKVDFLDVLESYNLEQIQTKEMLYGIPLKAIRALKKKKKKRKESANFCSVNLKVENQMNLSNFHQQQINLWLLSENYPCFLITHEKGFYTGHWSEVLAENQNIGDNLHQIQGVLSHFKLEMLQKHYKKQIGYPLHFFELRDTVFDCPRKGVFETTEVGYVLAFNGRHFFRIKGFKENDYRWLLADFQQQTKKKAISDFFSLQSLNLKHLEQCAKRKTCCVKASKGKFKVLQLPQKYIEVNEMKQKTVFCTCSDTEEVITFSSYPPF